jgi:hypothetical protein
MASTLGQMAAQFRNLAETLPERANAVRKQIARTINFDLLQTTPVDTGQAVSNWQVTLDEVPEGIRPAFVPSREGYMKQKDGEKSWVHRVDPELTRQQNIAPAMDLANQTIDATLPNQVINITNNLDYIQALDEGHSEQAQLFVDRATLLGADIVSRAKIID